MITQTIVLTEYGETLMVRPDRFPIPVKDEEQMCGELGIHTSCRGTVYINNVSETHSALSCDGCYLRIVIPKSVDTFGKLREHFRQFNP